MKKLAEHLPEMTEENRRCLADLSVKLLEYAEDNNLTSDEIDQLTNHVKSEFQHPYNHAWRVQKRRNSLKIVSENLA
ncbi:hypothetical protein [Dinoroseobacter sp. S76]|uniref:hypothetical protein n=1 Tax=Dinoroseobacter sp. S76 TaxID=3415124 RepID=UPI003C7A4786